MKAFEETDDISEDVYSKFVKCSNCSHRALLHFIKGHRISDHECPRCGCEDLSKSDPKNVVDKFDV